MNTRTGGALWAFRLTQLLLVSGACYMLAQTSGQVWVLTLSVLLATAGTLVLGCGVNFLLKQRLVPLGEKESAWHWPLIQLGSTSTIIGWFAVRLLAGSDSWWYASNYLLALIPVAGITMAAIWFGLSFTFKPDKRIGMTAVAFGLGCLAGILGQMPPLLTFIGTRAMLF